MSHFEMTVRCSELGELMGFSYDKMSIGKTCYSKIEEIARRQLGFVELPILAEPINKGIELEIDGIKEVQKLYPNEFIEKNTERKTIEIFSGVFLTGECDIQTRESIDDIKIPFNFDSWLISKENKNYRWQLLGYMHLWNKKKANIHSVWLPTPLHLIEESVKKYWFAYGGDERYSQVLETAIKNHSITVGKPVKTIALEYDEKDWSFAINRLQELKEYHDNYIKNTQNELN